MSIALGASVLLRADLSARQGRGGGAPAGPPAPDAIPTAVSSIMANPSAFIGHVVSAGASVARQVNATIFIVNQNHNPAQGEILVIAPALFKVPAVDAYITVIGDLVAFDPAEVTKKFSTYKLDLPADVAAKFAGKPAILATAIVGSNMSDLTKRPPAPMTPEDQKLSAIMQQVSPASAAMRTAAGASDAATIKAKAAELHKLFADADEVFKGKNILTAMLMVSDAQKQVTAAETAAAAGKWADVTTATTALGQVCTSCHTAHRDRMDDGTYRLKGGS